MAKGIKTGGRKKGTPNKTTAALKELVLGALTDVGGQAYLARQAQENPSAFMTLLGKVLPHQLAGDKDGTEPIKIQVVDFSTLANAEDPPPP